MKKTSLNSLLVLLFAFLANSVVVAADNANQTDEERCQAYAKEDNVPAAELADFMKDCLESLKGDNEEKEKKE
jgi:hypothetical protein